MLFACLEKDPKRRLRDIGDFRILCQIMPEKVGAAAPTRRAFLWMGVSGLVLLFALAILAFVHFRQAPPAERVLRLSVPLPENSLIGYFALSPDGGHVVMSLLSRGKLSISYATCFWILDTGCLIRSLV